MNAEWLDWCREDDLVVEGNKVDVRFRDGRHHWIMVEQGDDSFEIQSIVARSAVVGKLGDMSMQLWKLNRRTSLVGFRVDSSERLIGETWIPKASLCKSEFLFYLRTLAAECDRLEYVLTGSDSE